MTDVLDHGFVILEEHMGGDAAVLEAARICYGSSSKGEDADRKLIRRLLRESHGTPLEHAVFRFRVKCPLFVCQQWLRHRMASYNQKSLRYCEAKADFYVPQTDIVTQLEYAKILNEQWRSYKWLMDNRNVSREQARGVLGSAFYTEFVWTVNCWSLINFLNKRTDKAAQWETRQYAEAIIPLWESVMPITVGAWWEREMRK